MALLPNVALAIRALHLLLGIITRRPFPRLASSVLQTKPCPAWKRLAPLYLSSDGAGAEPQGIDVVAAETIMRRLFPALPPLRFQGLMRVMCHEVLGHIQDCHPSRQARMHARLIASVALMQKANPDAVCAC